MTEISEMPDEIYEDEFFLVTDDPDEQMVNVAFVERSLVIRFDYEEFLELFRVLEQTRDHVQRRLKSASRPS